MKNVTKKGSLLIDLMIAITIFLIATSLTLYLSFAVIKMQCIMELSLLKQAIQATQLEAIATGIDQTIAIDYKKNEYKKGDTTTSFKALVIGYSNTTIPHLHNQKTNPSFPCSFANNAITCFKSGVISGGTLYFSACGDKSLFFCLSCPVSQVNSINIYEYKKGWTHRG